LGKDVKPKSTYVVESKKFGSIKKEYNPNKEIRGINKEMRKGMNSKIG
jgi:hypothetical protein